MPKILVGNKVDLAKFVPDSVVEDFKIKEMVKKNDEMKFFKTSALFGD